jgi:hypothetical protein
MGVMLVELFVRLFGVTLFALLAGCGLVFACVGAPWWFYGWLLAAGLGGEAWLAVSATGWARRKACAFPESTDEDLAERPGGL